MQESALPINGAISRFAIGAYRVIIVGHMALYSEAVRRL